MKIIYKSQHKIVLMVVITLLLQIVGPVVGDYVYADGGGAPPGGEGAEESFKIVREDIEGDTVTIYWEYEYTPNGEKTYNIPVNFILTEGEEKSGELKVEDVGEIGGYSISKNGQMTVEINEKAIKKLLGEPEEEETEAEVPLTPSVPATSVELDNPGDFDDIDETGGTETEGEGDLNQTPERNGDETTTEPETEGDSTRIIENLLGLFSKNVVYAEGADEEEVREYTFSGNFEVEGVMPKPKGRTPVVLSEGGDSYFSQFITKVIVEYEETSGNWVEIKDDVTGYNEDSNLRITYTYSLPNLEDEGESQYYEVDIDNPYILTLPNEIEVTETQIRTLEIGNGVEVGYVTFESGQIKIEFNKSVNAPDEDYGYDRGGKFTVTSKFGEIKLDEDGKGKIIFETSTDPIKIDINIPPVEVKKNIELNKSGVYNKETNKIKWTITVKPSSTPDNEPIAGLVITDTLDITSPYTDHKIIISEDNGPKITKNGNDFIKGEFTTTEEGLVYTFNNEVNTEKNEVYEIVFYTEPGENVFIGSNEETKLKFKNDVIAEYTDGPEDSIKASATTKEEIKVDFISKSGKFIPGDSREENRIEWYITINQNYQELTGVKITDTVEYGLEIDDSFIKLYEGLKAEGNDIAETNEWEVDTDNKTLTYNFTDKITGPYTLVFRTKITHPKAYESNTQKKFSNTAKITWDGDTTGPEGTVEGEGVGVETNVIDKTVDNNKIDYKNHIIPWTIVVNKNKIEMTEPSILDTLPVGLKYVPGSFKVNDKEAIEGNEVEGFNYDEAERKLTYDFEGYLEANKTSNTYTITFETEVTDSGIYGKQGITNITNTAILIRGNDKVDDSATANYNSQVIEKSGDYNHATKQATWTITVNKNNMQIDNAYVVDKIEDIWKVVQVKINDTETEEYEFEDGNFKYTFSNPIETQQIITIVTEINDPLEFFKDNWEGDKYKYNQAILHGEQISGDNQTSNNASVIIRNKIVDKKGELREKEYKINWTVQVNQNGAKIENPTLVDVLPDGLILDTESVKVYDLNLAANGTLTKSVSEAELENKSISYDANTNKFEFSFGETINTAYQLEFTTDIEVATGKEYSFNNTITFSGSENTQDGGTTIRKFRYTESDAAAWGSARGTITITKVDSEDERALAGAIFELLDEYGIVLKVSNPTGADGVVSFKGLHLNRTYRVRESKAPEGYELDEEPSREIKVEKSTAHEIYEEKIENIKIKTDITSKKEWIGGPEEKPTIELQLYRNGIEFRDSVELKNGETEYTWEDLDEYDDFGKEYKYTVKEVEVPENYISKVSANGLIVTNTYVIPKDVEVTGTKEWVGGPETKPAIKLQLFRDGEVIETIDLDGTEENGWSYTWKNLDRTDEHGINYVYSIDEAEAPIDYEISYENDSLTVINTYKSPIKDIKATKIWENGKFNRPNFIELQLYRQIDGEDKEEVGNLVRLEKGGYDYIWKDQPVYNNEGKEYTYIVEEVNVPDNYTSTVGTDGLTVTNTYVIPKIEIRGYKEWIGGPLSKPTIELQLYRNGTAYGQPVELADGETEYTWKNLDKTDINGREYKYTIEEVQIPRNYRMTISDDGLTITNRYRRPTGPGPGPGPRPTEPTDPKEPEKPVEPTDPGEPEVPVDPTDPTDPVDPTGPETPEEPLIPIVLDPPAKGTVTFDKDGNWTYTPNPGATGKDSFVIVHPDGTEELIEIDLDDLPLGTTGVKNGQPILPKTGAANNLVFYTTGLLLIALGVFLRKRKVV